MTLTSSNPTHPAPAGDRERRIIESTLGFFASVIRSGEPWTIECIDALDRAKAALAALTPGETPAEPTPDAARETVSAIKTLLMSNRFNHRRGDPLYDAVFAHVVHASSPTPGAASETFTEEEIGALDEAIGEFRTQLADATKEKDRAFCRGMIRDLSSLLGKLSARASRAGGTV